MSWIGCGPATMVTGQRFGCAHHERLELEPARISPQAKRCEERCQLVGQAELKAGFRQEEPMSKWLAHAIFARHPFESLLEIGSGSGRNLHHLKQSFPAASFAGCDVADTAVTFARTKTVGIPYETCSLYDLPYADSQFDAVLLCSTLMCVPPDDLPTALAEVKRVAGRRIVAVEWFTRGSYGAPVDEERLLWSRDYTSAFEPEFVCVEVQPLAYAYDGSDVPLFCWVLEGGGHAAQM